MLTEVSLIEALTAFVNDKRVIILNSDDLVAVSLEEELKALKDPKVHFLVDAAAVGDPDQTPKTRTRKNGEKGGEGHGSQTEAQVHEETELCRNGSTNGPKG